MFPQDNFPRMGHMRDIQHFCQLGRNLGRCTVNRLVFRKGRDRKGRDCEFPPDRAHAVASVSAPANVASHRSAPLSAPMARASSRLFRAWAGPIVTTVTVPPNLSLMRRASSSACRSRGFVMAGIPVLRIVPVEASIVILSKKSGSGTCLIQTTIFIAISIPVN